ncbi:O-unit flippase-like protein [Sphingosinithalassobacter sp. LHW66-3]|uniref:O-unit flippase-like protein n=1 Tax=Sphingosinithalassobacter sp. LHW66-3 TaxID=3424718 RepID=UPI003D6BD8A0
MAFGLVAQFLQFGSALALIPFMVTRLSTAEVGLWFVFVAAQGLAIISDFGFQPTLVRAFALGQAGAERLERQGLGSSAGLEPRPPNAQLLAAALGAAKRLYRWIAAVILFVLLAAGLPYMTMLARDGGVAESMVQLAWVIFSINIALILLFQWITPLLMGTGRIQQNYLFLIANRGLYAIVGIVVLLAGGGLVALAVAAVAGQIASRAVAQFLIAPAAAPLRRIKVTAGERAATLAAIWPNASRMGVVAIGAFLINRYTLFAISSFIGVAAAAPYALSLQMLMAVGAVAQLPMLITTPQIVALRVRHDRAGLRQLLARNLGLFVLLFLLGAVAAAVVVPWLLILIGSRTALLPTGTLLLLSLVLMLEGFHSTAASFITTRNEVPFVPAALISGLCVGILTTLAGWLGGGIAIMIACQGLVQLAYNNWRWPLAAWKEVRAE